MKNIVYSTALIFFLISFTHCSSEPTQTAEFSGETVSVTLSKTEANSAGGFAVASGKLVSKSSVNVSTRMMGYITSMPVEVGQNVRAGQLLVAINNTDIQAKGGQVNAQIMQAQAGFESAKKDYERFQNLFASQSASQKELDDMQARYDMARAGLEAARQMKNEVNAENRYANVTAPISGVVTAKFVEQGDMASPGMPLLTIESPSSLQAQLMVSEQYITQIKDGMDVDVLIKSSGKEVKGTVAEISRSSAHTGGQYMIKVNLPKTDDLLSGMYVNARFPFETSGSTNTEKASSILIPTSALVRNGQMTGVYTVSSQNTALLRWLKLGKEMGEEVEVLSGLSAGESYVLSADGKLYNGAKLSVK